MRRFFESDTGFYVGVGLFTILVFVVGLAAIAIGRPGSIRGRELTGFIVGFSLFMASYFIAISVYQLVPEDA